MPVLPPARLASACSRPPSFRGIVNARQGAKTGKPFGQRYLYEWWEKACASNGVEGVDLYGGSKHITAVPIRHPADHLDLEELELYIFNLAFECDRFEFIISGGDRF